MPAIAAGAALIMAAGLTVAACSSAAAKPAKPAQPTLKHFSAVYYEGSASWNCSGTRTITAGGSAKDSETCLITGVTNGYAKMVGTYTGHPGVKWPGSKPGSRPALWHSDYNHAVASAWTITITDTHHVGFSGADNYQAHITAFYDS